MNTSLRLAVVGLAILVMLGLGATVTAGAQVTELAEDPVSVIGHVCD